MTRIAGAIRLERFRYDPDIGVTQERFAGYVIPGVFPWRGTVRASAYLLSMSAIHCQHRGESQPLPLHPTSRNQEMTRLRPIGRLVAIAPPRATATLRPVQSGEAFRIISPPGHGLVRPELAAAIEIVFETFARACGATPENPLEIRLARGFQSGSPGHGEGRALDIVAVGGKDWGIWKQEWDQAVEAAEKISDAGERDQALVAEQKRNLGFGLYKALQAHGGWRVNQTGWRRYRNVMQLFGPWTATEGPWRTMQIENPSPYQRQRLADQEWVFRQHRDHIHVAR
jgi:hypothetical protein